MIKSFFFFLFSILSGFLFSQELSTINYSTKDGLPSSEVYEVLQDKKGYMWFATDAGVAKFNGKTFEVFDVSKGLSDNTVFGITEDKYGRIWCRTYSGRIHYIDNDSIYGIAANDELVKLISPSIVYAAFIGNGDTLHVGATGLLAKKEVLYFKIPRTNNFKTVIPIKSINIPNAQFQYFGKKNSFIFLARYLSLSSNELRIIDSNNIVSKVFPAPKDWENGIIGGILYKLKKRGYLAVSKGGKNYLINEKEFIEIVLDNRVISYFEDKDENIWIGLNQGGVLFYEKGNISLTPKKYLSKLSITSITQDHENGMWFSTIENGVYYSQNFKIMTLKNINNIDLPKVESLYNTGNELFILTKKNDFVQIKKENQLFEINNLNFNEQFSSISKLGNKYYLGGRNIYETTDLRTKELNIIKIKVKMFFKVIQSDTLNEQIYAADNRNIMILKNSNILLNKRIDTRIFSFCFDKKANQILMGTHFGLKVLKNDSIQDYELEVPYRINDLKFDQNHNLWIATNENGVYCSTKDSLYSFNFNNGLTNNKINKILVLKNQVWVITYGGISKISKNGQNFSIENFNTSHGLLSNQNTDICFFDNQLLVNSKEGLNIFKPSEIQRNSIHPKTVIKSIRINDSSFNVTDSVVELNYFQNNLNLEIDVLSYKEPKKNANKYRLIGYDSEFKLHSNNEINYTNLSPGYYELWVYGINNDGFESLEAKIFKFRIAKPFWLKWWFIVAEILTLLFIIFLVFKYRVGLIKKEEADKTAINKKLAEFQLTALRAQMNPHFIFNAISSVQHYVLKNDINQSYDYLAKFSHLIRMVLNNSNQNKIHIDQEIETLRLYISLEKLRFEHEFEFFIDIGKDLEDSDISIPSMLIQPFVENAIWHGLMPKGNNCILKLSFNLISENILQVIIEDNGIGRLKSKEIKSKSSHKSKGMFLTAERISLLKNNQGENSKIEIIDLYNKKNQPIGTKVILEIQID